MPADKWQNDNIMATDSIVFSFVLSSLLQATAICEVSNKMVVDIDRYSEGNNGTGHWRS